MLNFKLKGSCTINVVDSKTGVVKQTIEKENLIMNYTLAAILDWVPRPVFADYYQIPVGNTYDVFVTYIFISASTVTPSLSGNPSVLAQAYTPSGVTRTTFNASTNPIYGQIQQRIDYTGNPRTFQTVGLIQKDNYGNTRGILCYLLLDTPCTQGAYDYLDLFYRVQFINAGGQGLATDDALLDFARGCFGVSGTFNMSWATAWVGKAPSSDSLYKRYGSSNGMAVSLGASINSAHFKFKMGFSANLTQSIGMIFSSFLQGAASLGGYHTIKNIQNPNSPFQNIFTHSANATVPFFDSLTSAGGNGKIRTSGTWTGKFPELYKITMVTGGAVGTATYKYSVRKHLGFNGNSYSDLAFNSPYRIDLPGFHGQKEENNDLLRWSNTQIVQYDQTGVMLLDVYDGSYKIWDATTTPALTATQIRQCAVDTANQKIYVGCRTTGLWVIDVASNAIAHPFTSPCYGVDVGRNNVAYALIDGGLYRSSDWSTPLNFVYAGVTDNNWNRVLFLKADPEHASDRLCLVTTVPNQSNKIVWYQGSTALFNATLTYSSNGDVNGVAYLIGTNYGVTAWSNPHSIGSVTCQMSSVEIGNVSMLVNRAGGENLHTYDVANSWASIDLGVGNTIIPNYYILRLRGQYAGYAIRNWKLQGSNNAASNSVADLNAATWVDLDVRINDTTMQSSADSWGNYAVTGVTTGYRWLRILQNGVNSTGDNYLILGEFEFYGSFTRDDTIANGPQSSSIKSYPASLDVSDTGSFWASGAGRLTFGSTSLGSLGGSLTSYQFTHPIYGNDAYYKIAFYNQYLILRDRIVDINSSTINTFSTLGQFASESGRSAVLHLDSGIVILSGFLRQLFTDNSYCYSHFGWNGSSWELNHPGAKTTHTDNQLLGNGINIRFENGANAPHFISTDFFTQSICFGKHKDNSSTISHNSCWYSVGAIFNQPVQSGATIPATAPYTITLSAATEADFRRLETDSSELHKFTINGSPVTTVYTDGRAPGINEVSVNENGVVTFNSSNAGANFSGIYTYLKL